jgi:carbamoyltransferase
MANILGISAFFHDSAAALTSNGTLLAAAQEERFSRIKNDAAFPEHAINYCLSKNFITADKLDAVVFYDKPFLKVERLLESYLSEAPKGFKQFAHAVPLWVNEKILLKQLLKRKLAEWGVNFSKCKLLFSEHHLSHAASAYYPSPFNESAILTIDGVGEWATTTMMHARENTITKLKELHFPHSLGLLYSAFTQFLGFKVNSGEYKVMGLAPYGNDQSEQCQNYITKIRNEIVDIKPDGSIALNLTYFDFITGLSLIHVRNWENLFKLQARKPESAIQVQHCNLALAIQTIVESIINLLAQEARHLTQSDNLCLAGGVALNCVAAGKLNHQKIFKKIYIQPASGDAGGAVGAALAAEHIYFSSTKERAAQSHAMSGCYLGPEYADWQIEQCLSEFGMPYFQVSSEAALCEYVAGKIADGAIIGWFQGRMEFGPRALGARSILANPSIPAIQNILNEKIKRRENFRPFAPAMLSQDYKYFFEGDQENEFMSFTDFLKPEHRLVAPFHDDELPLHVRLSMVRSGIHGATHVDYSSRIQVVDEHTNPLFHSLLSAFKKISGKGVLINTSFNQRGQPIVCSPHDACTAFNNMDLDLLVMNRFIISKKKATV